MATAKTKEEIIVKYYERLEHYRNIVKKWEIAVTKAEGRKSTKEDFRQAPENIQKAYKEYRKLFVYLKKNSVSNNHQSTSSGKTLTPKKIFHSKFSSPDKQDVPTQKRMKKVSLDSKNSKKKSFRNESVFIKEAELGYSRFSEKIFNAINVLSAKVKNNEHGNSADPENEVTKNELLNCTLNKFNQNNDSANQSMQGIDHQSNSVEYDNTKELDRSQGPSSHSEASTKLNPVSGVWQSFSPNLKSNVLKAEQLKQVDSGWLVRCGEDFENGMENFEIEIREIPQLNVLEDIDEDDSCANQNNERLFTDGFQNLLLSAGFDTKTSDKNELTTSNQDTKETYSFQTNGESQSVNGVELVIHLNNSENTLNPVYDENSYSFPLNTTETDHTFQNPYPDPESSSKITEACSPSDNVMCSVSASAVPECTQLACSRKRSALFALSPSPKKLEPKRKFFKSIRTAVKLPKYTVSSYKPPTPIKKKVAAPPVPLEKWKMPKLVLVTSEDASTTSHNNENKQNTIVEESKEAEKNVSSIISDKLSSSTTCSIEVDSKPLSSKTVKQSEVKKSRTRKMCNKNKRGPIEKTLEKEKSTSYNQVTTSEYFDDVPTESTSRKGTKLVRLTNKKRLQSKMDTGKINENFVRIDITKKVFVRGKKRMTGASVKRNDWKQKKASASKEEKMKNLKCRKCGECGHFAKFCMKGMAPQEEPEEVDDSPFPTLEEAARMVKKQTGAKRVNIYASNNNNSTRTDSEKNPEPLVGVRDTVLNDTDPLPEYTSAMTAPVRPVPPYFGNEARSVVSPEEETAILKDALRKFGYENFRGGQFEAISRVMKGLSTLVILSTGSGKSLCYQLPAYLYAKKFPGALAICVSPLVSLMEDQVQGIPPFLEAACLHHNMSSIQKEKVLDRIRSKKLHVLLVSPEAVCGGLFGLLRGEKDLPLISFACIDEVHCVSEWSHNFRPGYLQLSKILRERLNITTILGLTATATATTAMNICEHLQVDPSTTIRGEIIPSNLHLSVSRDTYRDEALLVLLRGERFKDCQSIIIYCTRRDECERIAVLIRTNLQEIPGYNGITKTNLRQRVSNNCEVYHAGMSPSRRRLVQQHFMSGKIRIVVATVAFGMGIDKSDIRSVIHYNMPKAFESYVQEIGRAGRDGLPAHCHLFLDSAKGGDLKELRRHVYANSVDRPTLRKLLSKVFQPCKCKRLSEISNRDFQNSDVRTTQGTMRCPGHEVSFNIEETINELDLPKENITTLLCYLELDKSRKLVELLPHTYEKCKIHFYGGCKLIKFSALKCPPLAAAIALKTEQKTFKETDPYIEFNVIEVSSTLGWNSGIVKRELKNLEWSGIDVDNNGQSTKFRRSGILVEFCDLAYHLKAPGDLTDEEADNILNYLHKHNTDQERSQLYQLSRVYQALQCISFPNVDAPADEFNEEKSNMLKKFINNYFSQTTVGVPENWRADVSQGEEKRDEICRDVQELICKHKDIQFTGRAIAKIFQGIHSPCFPAEIWGRNRNFWRKHLDVDFPFLCQVAGQEILRFG